jgi:uncharacterized protein DUF4386
MRFTVWERWGPLTGLLAVALWIISFAVGGSSPDTNDSDAKITAYYAGHSHQVRQATAFFIFVAGVLLFLGFLAALRSRSVDAEGGGGRLSALGFGSGIAAAALFIAAIAIFQSPAITANDTGKFTLDPNTFRILNDLGYLVWVGAVIVAAVLVWATSSIALRSGLLPKWFAWLGVLAGILQLFAIFFIPIFIFWGWIVIVALFLVFRRAAAAPISQEPAGA